MRHGGEIVHFGKFTCTCTNYSGTGGNTSEFFFPEITSSLAKLTESQEQVVHVKIMQYGHNGTSQLCLLYHHSRPDAETTSTAWLLPQTYSAITTYRLPAILLPWQR